MVKSPSDWLSVDELLYNRIFVRRPEDNMLVVSNRPDWIVHPKNGYKVHIKEILVSDKDFGCPQCKALGKHGVIKLKDSNEFIVCCSTCNLFLFCEVK